jgi:hypothetical protein
LKGSETPGGSNEPRRLGKGSENLPREKSRRAWALGIALVVVSVVLPVIALIVLFLPLSVGWKAGVVTILLVAGETAFWASALVLGRETVRRYRRFLDPRYWLDKKLR